MPNEYDAIVIGAGASGMCCAGELVALGAKPFVVCETKEVGYQFRSARIGKDQANRVVVQCPTRNLWGEGGWWYGVARRLNVPVRMEQYYRGGLALTPLGSGTVTNIPACASASALTAEIAALFGPPVPLGASAAELERVFDIALQMPWETVNNMRRIRLQEWLAGITKDEVTTAVVMQLVIMFSYLDAEIATEHCSAFMFILMIRSYLCGETDMVSIIPDAREGLFIPMATEIERRGGVISRGVKLDKVIVENDRAVGVLLKDGTEVRAPIVAFGIVNTDRIADLLETVPPEVTAVREYDAQLGDNDEHTLYVLLNRRLDKHPGKVVCALAPDEGLGAFWNITSVAPWGTELGKEIIGLEVVRSRATVEAMGGVEALHNRMNEMGELTYPGWLDATEDVVIHKHPQLVSPWMVGPKLPRECPSVPGLWFVGENSTPTDGAYVDGAASAGVLGARAMVAQRKLVGATA